MIIFFSVLSKLHFASIATMVFFRLNWMIMHESTWIMEFCGQLPVSLQQTWLLWQSQWQSPIKLAARSLPPIKKSSLTSQCCHQLSWAFFWSSKSILFNVAINSLVQCCNSSSTHLAGPCGSTVSLQDILKRLWKSSESKWIFPAKHWKHLRTIEKRGNGAPLIRKHRNCIPMLNCKRSCSCDRRNDTCQLTRKVHDCWIYDPTNFKKIFGCLQSSDLECDDFKSQFEKRLNAATISHKFKIFTVNQHSPPDFPVCWHCVIAQTNSLLFFAMKQCLWSGFGALCCWICFRWRLLCCWQNGRFIFSTLPDQHFQPIHNDPIFWGPFIIIVPIQKWLAFCWQTAVRQVESQSDASDITKLDFEKPKHCLKSA